MGVGNGNGKNRWWANIVMTLVVSIFAAGGAFAALRVHVTNNTTTIIEIERQQKIDHDCLIELKTELPRIRADLKEIKSLLRPNESGR